MTNEEHKAPARFAWPRAAAHWILAGLILFLLASGLLGLANTADTDPAKIGILRGHMVAGLAAMAVMILYVLAMLMSRRPPKASSGHALLDALATLIHVGLPLSALVMIASGIATALAAGLGEAVFGGTADRIPALVRTLPSFHVHSWAACALLALLLLHLLGSLYHQFVLRDGLFRRMAPWGRRRNPREPGGTA